MSSFANKQYSTHSRASKQEDSSEVQSKKYWMFQTDVKFILNVHAHFANIPIVNPYSADLFGPKELSTNYVY